MGTSYIAEFLGCDGISKIKKKRPGVQLHQKYMTMQYIHLQTENAHKQGI